MNTQLAFLHGNIENVSQVDLQRAIRQCVENAIIAFNEKEEYLIRNDLCERCICARFAIYLDREIQNSKFSDYIVDVEYNRGYQGKDSAIKQLHGKNVVVDLIVHKRSHCEPYGFDNLICIEMKKTPQPSKLQHDKDRLRCMTDQKQGFNYKAGYMIIAFADHRRKAYGLRIHSAFCDGHDYPG